MTELDYAKRLILDTGSWLKAQLAAPRLIETKSRFDDLVTDLDRAVQARLVQAISEAYPGHQFLAEEGDAYRMHPGEADHLWVIDPIDGTSNFVTQAVDFAIMIAYYAFGKPKFGLIYDVMAGKLFWGDTQRAFCNDQRLVPPKIQSVFDGLIGVNSHLYSKNSHGLQDFASKSLGVRVLGSAGIEYSRLLEGRHTAYISNLYPWDYAAGSILIQALGFATVALGRDSLNFRDRQLVASLPADQLSQLTSTMGDYQLLPSDWRL